MLNAATRTLRLHCAVERLPIADEPTVPHLNGFKMALQRFVQGSHVGRRGLERGRLCIHYLVELRQQRYGAGAAQRAAVVLRPFLVPAAGAGGGYSPVGWWIGPGGMAFVELDLLGLQSRGSSNAKRVKPHKTIAVMRFGWLRQATPCWRTERKLLAMWQYRQRLAAMQTLRPPIAKPRSFLLRGKSWLAAC